MGKLLIAKLIQRENYAQMGRYAFILPRNELVQTMTDFLMALTESALRIELITKAKSALPPKVISLISGNIAKRVIDESIQCAWTPALCEAEVPLDVEDMHRIDSLKCLLIVQAQDSAESVLLRANQLLLMFARAQKWEGIRRLINDIDSDMERTALRHHLEADGGCDCHLNAYRCFLLFKEVLD